MSDGRVLVVEDDAGLGMVLVGQLKQGGIRATHVSSGIEALEAFDADGYDVVITDYQMPGMNGLELLARLKERVAELPVIMITAHGDVSLAVNALKAGAAEFFEKPFDREAVLFTVKKALETSDKLASQPPKARIGADLLGDALAMNECRETIEAAARTMAHVLIRGESGSGKEVAARAIHNEGLRKAGAFIAVNCAALPDQLLESELFGYEKGAFTGAASRKPGRVELAQGGTLFLDEIGDVSPAVQAKLLRLLQEKQFEPLGSTRTHDADVRFIAATHRNLEDMVEEDSFRQDLFFRLNVIPIWMPPLRDRATDIPLLAKHFVTKAAADNHRPSMTLADAAAAKLGEQRWPGNVRELMNFVERLVVFSAGDVIDVADVQREQARNQRHRTGPGPTSGPTSSERASSLEAARSEAEHVAVVEALERAGGNRTRAARLLGVSRRKLYNLLAAHDIA